MIDLEFEEVFIVSDVLLCVGGNGCSEGRVLNKFGCTKDVVLFALLPEVEARSRE